jgi:thiol-disulfide isomerase/thioredoxin
MFKTTLILVLATLCLNFSSKAQAPPDKIRPLKIGDTIPEALWNMPLQVINHPQGKKTITLNEYRNKKLIIIDFWGSYCSPCLASIDKLIPISKKYAEDMALVAVTAHDLTPQAALKTMKRKQWTIPSVFDGDKFLYTKAFPNSYGNGIPYIIWIQNNHITAIPQLAYNTEENILKAIKGEKVEMQMKLTNLKPLDYTLPLFTAGNGETGLYYRNPPYAVIARYLPGYSTGRKTSYIQKGDTTILAAVNRKLKDMVFDAWQGSIFPALDAENGIVWEISDSLKNRLFNAPKYDKIHNLANNLAFMDWIKKNTYGYNLRFPENISPQQAYYFMQQDISRFFGAYLNLSFTMSQARRSYAVLLPASTAENAMLLLQSANKDRQFNHVDYSASLLHRISRALPGLSVSTVVDSTGIDPGLRIDYDFPDQLYGNTGALKQALKAYGLRLEVRERDVPVLFISQQPANIKNNNQLKTLKN